MEWIPVSETLPQEDMQYVLCTAACGGEGYRYYTEIKEYLVTEGFGEMVYNENYDDENEDEEIDEYYFHPVKVIAWAPIPSLESKAWNACHRLPEKDYGYCDNLIVARKTPDGIVYETCLYCKDGKISIFDSCEPIKNSFGYIAQDEGDYEAKYHELKDVVAWMVAPEPYVIPRPAVVERRTYIPIDEIVSGKITEFNYYAWQPASKFSLMENLMTLSMALYRDKRIDVYDIKDNKYFKVIIRDEKDGPKDYYLSDKDFTIECRKLKRGISVSDYDKHYFVIREKVVVNGVLLKYRDAKYLFSDDFLLEETCKWVGSNYKNQIEKFWNDISKEEKEYKENENQNDLPF